MASIPPQSTAGNSIIKTFFPSFLFLRQLHFPRASDREPLLTVKHFVNSCLASRARPTVPRRFPFSVSTREREKMGNLRTENGAGVSHMARITELKTTVSF